MIIHCALFLSIRHHNDVEFYCVGGDNEDEMEVVKKTLAKTWVKLPGRHMSYRWPSPVEAPDKWNVALIGKITCDNVVFAVFFDKVSKKVFYWIGKKEQLQNLCLSNEEKVYSSWPTEMIEVKANRFNAFRAFVYGYGHDFVTMPDKEKKEKLLNNVQKALKL
jgi:hypothetical protein